MLQPIGVSQVSVLEALPVGATIEGVDPGDDPLHVVLVVAHSHRVTVEVISAGGIPVAVACMQSADMQW